MSFRNNGGKLGAPRHNHKFENGYNSETGTVLCQINAPDIYSYFQTHENDLMEMDEEQLLATVKEAIGNEEFPRKEETIELPAEVIDGKVVVDNNSYDYQDAVTGGLYTYLTELYEKALQEVGEG